MTASPRASMKTIGILVLGYLVAFTVGEDDASLVKGVGNVIGQVVEVVNQCGEEDIVYCLKQRALRYLDTTSGPIELSKGIVLKETEPSKDESAVTADPSSDKGSLDQPRTRENAIDNQLMDRVAKFLASHTLEIRLPKITEGLKRNMDADEGKKGINIKE